MKNETKTQEQLDKEAQNRQILYRKVIGYLAARLSTLSGYLKYGLPTDHRDLRDSHFMRCGELNKAAGNAAGDLGELLHVLICNVHKLESPGKLGSVSSEEFKAAGFHQSERGRRMSGDNPLAEMLSRLGINVETITADPKDVTPATDDSTDETPSKPFTLLPPNEDLN